MRYHVMTEVSPEDVLQHAREFYTEHARVEVPIRTGRLVWTSRI